MAKLKPYIQSNKEIIMYNNKVILETITGSAGTGITYNISIRTGSTALLSGYTMGVDILSQGFCWSLNSGATTGNSYKEVGGLGGLITYNLTGLTSGVTYYIKTFVRNEYGLSYGNEVQYKVCYYSLIVNREWYQNAVWRYFLNDIRSAYWSYYANGSWHGGGGLAGYFTPIDTNITIVKASYPLDYATCNTIEGLYQTAYYYL